MKAVSTISWYIKIKFRILWGLTKESSTNLKRCSEARISYKLNNKNKIISADTETDHREIFNENNLDATKVVLAFWSKKCDHSLPSLLSWLFDLQTPLGLCSLINSSHVDPSSCQHLPLPTLLLIPPDWNWAEDLFTPSNILVSTLATFHSQLHSTHPERAKSLLLSFSGFITAVKKAIP